MRRIRRHLSYANVMSTLAVVLVIGGGTAYAVATIGSEDVINESLRGVDIKNRSLLGEDLGVRVRGARQVDDGSAAATCGQGPDFDTCVAVSFNVPRPQRLLLVGSGEWFGLTGSDTNRGQCRFSIGNLADLGLRTFGEVTGQSPSNPFNLAMNSVTGVLDQGGYEIFLACRDLSGPTGGVTVKNTELSVAALGDG